jgi:hypothetical protein
MKRNFNYPYKELIDPEISIMRGAATSSGINFYLFFLT